MTRREGVVLWTVVGAVLLVLVVVVLALPAVLLIGGHQTVTSNIGNPSP